MCSEVHDPYSVRQRQFLPQCHAGAACHNCDGTGRPSAARQQPAAPTAAIVLFYGFDDEHLRRTNSRPLSQYLKDMMLMLRLVLSLRRVGTALPVRLYMAGQRFAKYEVPFRRLHVHVVGAPYIRPAPWANPWHAGTFAKLHALALVDFRKVLVLDLDCVVLRPIDHMVAFPTPSFRYQTVPDKGECRWEINSGVMLLRPDTQEYARALDMKISLTGRSPSSDGGDQSIWRALYHSVHELPTGYNTFKYDLEGVQKWASEAIFVLHDGWTMRWSHWWPEAHPALGHLLTDLTRNATALMTEASNFSTKANPKSMRDCFYQEAGRRNHWTSHVYYICDSKNLTPSSEPHAARSSWV